MEKESYLIKIQRQEQKISELKDKLFEYKLSVNNRLFGSQSSLKGRAIRSAVDVSCKREDAMEQRIEKEEMKLNKLKDSTK